ncbi:hypothetical protein [Streptomyces boetiae]
MDLPPIEQAATLLHRGSMEHLVSSLQAIARWTETHGYLPQPRGLGGASMPAMAREVHHETPGPGRSAWVTEVQEPVTRAA